ncbi:hypothetical protein BD408DRAFT_415134 [Parasitella parasitica]|nr:hypothetical protein BD408DRAFT_415134 [Parasitella parasitica]
MQYNLKLCAISLIVLSLFITETTQKKKKKHPRLPQSSVPQEWRKPPPIPTLNCLTMHDTFDNIPFNGCHANRACCPGLTCAAGGLCMPPGAAEQLSKNDQ